MDFTLLAEVFSQNTPFFICVSSIFGLMIGSFLNVVIYRFPIMLERAWLEGAREFLEEYERNHSEKKSSIEHSTDTATVIKTTPTDNEAATENETAVESGTIQSTQAPQQASTELTTASAPSDNHTQKESEETLPPDETDLDHSTDSPKQSACPKEEAFNLMVPRSRCPSCNHLIGALENIPVLSYLIQQGKCKNCKVSISPRYPIIETCTALLTGFLAWHFGPNAQFLAACVITWVLLSASMIDYDHQLLPDQLTLPLMWFGLVLAIYEVFVPLQDAVIGAAVGYLCLWTIFWTFKWITGKDGMGFGDFKLLAALGAWCGIQSLPTIIILSSFVGAVIGIGLIMFQGRDSSKPIPFGPYLALAGWLYLIFGESIDVHQWLFAA